MYYNRKFSRPRVQRKSQLEGANINMFISKAQNNSSVFEKPSEQIHKSFKDFNLASILQQNITNHGYTQPTQIQDQAIQPILDGRDVIGLASTGTGKTAAFLLPLIHKINHRG